MIGVAAGMALSGLRPVCYTITNFITYRCMEQIRVDLCYHHQPVIVVGTGSGLSYASLVGRTSRARKWACSAFFPACGGCPR